MTTATWPLTLDAIAANGVLGDSALLHFQPIMPGMARPVSP